MRIKKKSLKTNVFHINLPNAMVVQKLPNASTLLNKTCLALIKHNSIDSLVINLFAQR
jgi:hypothetical protein